MGRGAGGDDLQSCVWSHDRQIQIRRPSRGVATFGLWMVRAGADILAPADILVPIPLHPRRLLHRGFNQALELAREVAKRSGRKVSTRGLLRVRPTRSQVNLSLPQRRANVAAAFEVPERMRAHFAGRRVVLIDDVVTSGATTTAATRALLDAAAARVDVLALAWAPGGKGG